MQRVARRPTDVERVPEPLLPAGIRSLHVADWVTLARVPLAGAFVVVAPSRLGSFVVLAAAGASDVLDGWIARRRHESTRFGATLDPIVDKVFVVAVLGTLWAHGVLPVYAIGALLVREAAEAALVPWVLARAKLAELPVRAMPAGKLATALQFVTFAAALAFPAALPVLAATTAVAGAVAGFVYVRRALRASRRQPSLTG